MKHATALVSLATSVPPHVFHQKQVLNAAREIFGQYPEFETFSSIFANTGVINRYGVKPIEWYFERRGWPERTKAFLEGADALFIDVARKAIERADLAAGDIDTVVTVCSTGIATPSLEARVAGKLGLRSDVSRVPVFGLGCAGGVTGVSVASKLAQARPGTNVLLVAIELCTLAVRHEELTKVNLVAASLFGDGAAAMVLRAGDGGATRIEATGEHLWPDTLDIMGWNVDPEGFGVIFQRTIPDFVIANMNPAVTGILARWIFRSVMSTASSAIPAAPKWSARWRPPLPSIRACSIMNGMFLPITATCRARPCCSCSNVRARQAFHPGRC